MEGALNFHTYSMWVHNRGVNYDYDLQNIHRAKGIFFPLAMEFCNGYIMHYETLDPYVYNKGMHI